MTKMPELEELKRIIKCSINDYKDHVISNGCPTRIGCHKGKEIENYIKGDLQSDIQTFKNSAVVLEKEVRPMAKEAVEKAKSANDNIRTLFITVIGAMFLVLITSIVNQYSPIGGVAKLNKSINSSVQSLEKTLVEIINEKQKK